MDPAEVAKLPLVVASLAFALAYGATVVVALVARYDSPTLAGFSASASWGEDDNWALAARYMARPESKRAGFIAAGSQARGNFDALMPIFKLSEVVCYSRTLKSAEAFAAHAAAQGVKARATTNPREAVEGMDIVVSTVPHKSVGDLEIDGNWLAPGAYVAMVDLGYTFKRGTLSVIERFVTDDVEQSGPNGTERMVTQGPFAGELADLIAGKIKGRERAQERNAFIFSGVGLADTLPAALVYERAVAAGKGTVLPL